MVGRRRQLPASYEEFFQRLRSFHLLFMASPVVYVLLASLLKQQILGPQDGFVNLPSAEYDLLLSILLVMAIVVSLTTLFMLPRRYPVATLIEQNDSLLALGLALFQTHVLRVTLANVPAIFGLVLFLLNGVLSHLVVFALLSLVLLSAMFPHWSAWEEARKAFWAKST